MRSSLGSPDVDVPDDKRRRIGDEDMVVAYKTGWIHALAPTPMVHTSPHRKVSYYVIVKLAQDIGTLELAALDFELTAVAKVPFHHFQYRFW